MNPFKLTSALFFSILLTACVGQTIAPVDFKNAHITDSSQHARRILVTFTDREINRIPVDPVSHYRRRGPYQSSTWSQRVAKELAENYGLREVAEWPIKTLGVACVLYEIPGDRPVEQMLDILAKDERVESVQEMHVFHVLAEIHNDPYAALQTGLQAMQIEEAHRWATGKNVNIAVVDTGVDFEHPDLKGQVPVHQNFASEVSSSFSEDVHGTAIAGVIAAVADNGKGIVGVAPRSKLMALKACWPIAPNAVEALCDSFTLAKAIDNAVRLEPNVMNLSLAGPADPLLTRLLNKAIDQGIIVMAPDSGETNPTTEFPASLNNVIAVQVDRPNSAKKVAGAHTVKAPGDDVLTTVPHGGYDFLSGSSFAAAHVSGLVALLLELNPHLSVQAIVRILQSATTRIQAAEIIDACAALASVRGSPTCPGRAVTYGHALASPTHPSP